jgi:RNA polymerase sigma-70 factor (ECF subfamily)
MDLIAARSSQGMEILYDRYGALAFGLAVRILGDPGAAEDAVQEAFLSVWRRVATYRPERGSVRSWLCTVVRNRAIDRLRGRSGWAREELPIEQMRQVAAGGDTWSEVVAELDREHLLRAMDALPQEQRTTLEMAYFGGYTQSEISARMEVPLGTVKGRTRLALRALRSALGEWGAEHPV